jgi:nitroreductase
MDLATVDELLTTTRSVRKRLDLTRPVERAVIEGCLELAVQAPIGSNIATYHFVVVTDPAKRAQIATHYRQTMFQAYLPWRESDPATYAQSGPRFYDSLTYLADHLHEVPVHIIPCIEGRPEHFPTVTAQASWYGSILPATWSLMLALRSRGVGAAWTTLHLNYEQEVGALLGIPPTVTQVGLLATAYFTGTDFKPARRVPARERTYWDSWGE